MIYLCTSLLFMWLIIIFNQNNFTTSLLWWCAYWHEGGTITCHSHDITSKANHNHQIKSSPTFLFIYFTRIYITTGNKSLSQLLFHADLNFRVSKKCVFVLNGRFLILVCNSYNIHVLFNILFNNNHSQKYVLLLLYTE